MTATRCRRRGIAAVLFAAALATGCDGGPKPEPFVAPNDRPVVVYSTFDNVLIGPVFDAYEATTGVEINHQSTDRSDIVGMLLDKRRSPAADLAIAGDAAVLARAVDEDALRPVYSVSLEDAVPEALRDANGYWYGITAHLRPIVYDARRTDESSLEGYGSLAGDAFKGTLCLSSSALTTNRMLIAQLIAAAGEREAERLVRGWIDNLAVGPFGSDEALLDALAAGHCAVGVAGTRAVSALMRQQPDMPLALHWPAAADGSTHVGIAGGGVSRHARNPDGASALLEWLATEAGQRAFAGVRSDLMLDEFEAAGHDVAFLPAFAYRYDDAVLLAERVHYP